MRGTGTFLVGLLVVFGLAATEAPLTPLRTAGEDVDGIAAFDEWEYSGSAHVEASDAALFGAGPLEALVAGAITVQVFEYQEFHKTTARTSGDVGVFVWDYEPQWQTGVTEHIPQTTYGNARLRIAGGPDAVLLAWPEPGFDSGRFGLRLGQASQNTLFASAATSQWGAPGNLYGHWMEGPLFALAHDGTKDRFLRSADVNFDRLDAEGRLQVIVHGGATVTVESRLGVDTNETWTRNGLRIGDESAGSEFGRAARYAVITMVDAEMTMGFDGVKAILAAQTARWDVNGTLAFNAADGLMQIGDERLPLEDDAVELTGNTTLFVRATGNESIPGGAGGDIITPSLLVLEDPTVSADFTGDAEEVRVNGERTFSIPEPASTPAAEDVTWIASLLGLAFLVWKIGRWMIILVAGAHQNNPLAHPRRRLIHGFLQQAGLAHVRELHRATRIPVASLAHHLEVLKRDELVKCVKLGRHRIYFISSPHESNDDLRRLAFLAEPTRRRIAEALVHTDGLCQRELKEQLGLSQSSVSHQLRRLVQARLVEPQGSRDIQYRAAPLLKKWMQRAH